MIGVLLRLYLYLLIPGYALSFIMVNCSYRIFFTISFFYKIDKKQAITKSFKGDLTFNSRSVSKNLNDKNVYNEWEKYALKASLSELGSTSNYIDTLASEKKVTTHRIINTINLTEVFYN